jgi:hypothetical protein
MNPHEWTGTKNLHQRQDNALADQEQMIPIITTLDLSETEYQELTAIKIPLLQQDRLIIQNSIASVMTEEVCKTLIVSTLKKKLFLRFISLAKVTKCPFKTTAFVATLLQI